MFRRAAVPSSTLRALRALIAPASTAAQKQQPTNLQNECCTNGGRKGELLAGFAAGQRESANCSELTQFLNVPRVKVVPSTTATADFYALVYVALRRKGQPIPANDLWIAASTLEHGAARY
jgi:predicted nucleic acid-binding protein